MRWLAARFRLLGPRSQIGVLVGLALVGTAYADELAALVSDLLMGVAVLALAWWGLRIIVTAPLRR